MAEGADSLTKQQLFNILNVPYDSCTRQRYYQLASSRMVQLEDIKVINNRVLLLDAGVTPNPTWYDLVMKNNLIDVLNAPIRNNPVVTANEVKRLTKAEQSRFNFNGNSVILETVDYNALWTTEFENARIERAPFHNQAGKKLGYVDLMRITKRARLGYFKSLKAKVLELPVGANENFRMYFVIFLETSSVRKAFGIVTYEMIFEMFESLKESYVPVEVAIPRMIITSEIDMRSLIEDMGVTSLWNDPAATRNVSHPPALPSSYVQRASLTLNNRGLYSPSEQSAPFGADTGLDPKIENEFIANKPFVYGLFDTETLTCMIASVFSVPTYKN